MNVLLITLATIVISTLNITNELNKTYRETDPSSTLSQNKVFLRSFAPLKPAKFVTPQLLISSDQEN